MSGLFDIFAQAARTGEAERRFQRDRQLALSGAQQVDRITRNRLNEQARRDELESQRQELRQQQLDEQFRQQEFQVDREDEQFDRTLAERKLAQQRELSEADDIRQDQRIRDQQIRFEEREKRMQESLDKRLTASEERTKALIESREKTSEASLEERARQHDERMGRDELEDEMKRLKDELKQREEQHETFLKAEADAERIKAVSPEFFEQTYPERPLFAAAKEGDPIALDQVASLLEGRATRQRQEREKEIREAKRDRDAVMKRVEKYDFTATADDPSNIGLASALSEIGWNDLSDEEKFDLAAEHIATERKAAKEAIKKKEHGAFGPQSRSLPGPGVSGDDSPFQPGETGVGAGLAKGAEKAGGEPGVNPYAQPGYTLADSIAADQADLAEQYGEELIAAGIPKERIDLLRLGMLNSAQYRKILKGLQGEQDALRDLIRERVPVKAEVDISRQLVTDDISRTVSQEEEEARRAAVAPGPFRQAISKGADALGDAFQRNIAEPFIKVGETVAREGQPIIDKKTAELRAKAHGTDVEQELKDIRVQRQVEQRAAQARQKRIDERAAQIGEELSQSSSPVRTAVAIFNRDILPVARAIGQFPSDTELTVTDKGSITFAKKGSEEVAANTQAAMKRSSAAVDVFIQLAEDQADEGGVDPESSGFGTLGTAAGTNFGVGVGNQIIGALAKAVAHEGSGIETPLRIMDAPSSAASQLIYDDPDAMPIWQRIVFDIVGGGIFTGSGRAWRYLAADDLKGLLRMTPEEINKALIEDAGGSVLQEQLRKEALRRAAKEKGRNLGEILSRRGGFRTAEQRAADAAEAKKVRERIEELAAVNREIAEGEARQFIPDRPKAGVPPVFQGRGGESLDKAKPHLGGGIIPEPPKALLDAEGAVARDATERATDARIRRQMAEGVDDLVEQDRAFRQAQEQTPFLREARTPAETTPIIGRTGRPLEAAKPHPGRGLIPHQTPTRIAAEEAAAVEGGKRATVLQTAARHQREAEELIHKMERAAAQKKHRKAFIETGKPMTAAEATGAKPIQDAADSVKDIQKEVDRVGWSAYKARREAGIPETFNDGTGTWQYQGKRSAKGYHYRLLDEAGKPVGAGKIMAPDTVAKAVQEGVRTSDDAARAVAQAHQTGSPLDPKSIAKDVAPDAQPAVMAAAVAEDALQGSLRTAPKPHLGSGVANGDELVDAAEKAADSFSATPEALESARKMKAFGDDILEQAAKAKSAPKGGSSAPALAPFAAAGMVAEESEDSSNTGKFAAAALPFLVAGAFVFRGRLKGMTQRIRKAASDFVEDVTTGAAKHGGFRQARRARGLTAAASMSDNVVQAAADTPMRPRIVRPEDVVPEATDMSRTMLPTTGPDQAMPGIFFGGMDPNARKMEAHLHHLSGAMDPLMRNMDEVGSKALHEAAIAGTMTPEQANVMRAVDAVIVNASGGKMSYGRYIANQRSNLMKRMQGRSREEIQKALGELETNVFSNMRVAVSRSLHKRYLHDTGAIKHTTAAIESLPNSLKKSWMKSWIKDVSGDAIGGPEGWINRWYQATIYRATIGGSLSTPLKNATQVTNDFISEGTALPKAYKRMIEDMIEEGSFMAPVQRARAAGALSDIGHMFRPPQGAGGRAMEDLDDFLFWAQDATEAWNRATSFYVGMEGAARRGLKGQKAIDWALRHVSINHGHFGKLARAPIFRVPIVGSILRPLVTFPAKQSAFIWGTLKHGDWGQRARLILVYGSALYLSTQNHWGPLRGIDLSFLTDQGIGNPFTTANVRRARSAFRGDAPFFTGGQDVANFASDFAASQFQAVESPMVQFMRAVSSGDQGGVNRLSSIFIPGSLALQRYMREAGALKRGYVTENDKQPLLQMWFRTWQEFIRRSGTPEDRAAFWGVSDKDEIRISEYYGSGEAFIRMLGFQSVIKAKDREVKRRVYDLRDQDLEPLPPGESIERRQEIPSGDLIRGRERAALERTIRRASGDTKARLSGLITEGIQGTRPVPDETRERALEEVEKSRGGGRQRNTLLDFLGF